MPLAVSADSTFSSSTPMLDTPSSKEHPHYHLEVGILALFTYTTTNGSCNGERSPLVLSGSSNFAVYSLQVEQLVFMAGPEARCPLIKRHVPITIGNLATSGCIVSSTVGLATPESSMEPFWKTFRCHGELHSI